MTGWRFTVALFVLGTALCCSRCAHATTTADALAVACPGHQSLAPLIDEAARKHMQHPITLVAVMAVESGCRMDAVGAAGEVCAMQLLGVARNGNSRQALAGDPALCIATGARWLSLREADCGGGLFLGLSGYNARTCQGGKRYARKVLARISRIWRLIHERGSARS